MPMQKGLAISIVQCLNFSQKVLTSQLRDLERDGLVNRQVYPEVPPRVEYSLTDKGSSLCPVLSLLADWAAKNM